MTDFREREPSTPEESRLIIIQRKFDELGKVAWKAVVNGEEPDIDVVDEQQELKAAATVLLGEAVPADVPTTFVARYFYETNRKSPDRKKLQYPLDYMFYVATIEGSLQDVRAYPVDHPSPDRTGDIGFRLCARIAATQVMGLRTPPSKPEDFFVPVGEIYLNGHETDKARLEDEALEPSASRRSIF